MTSSASTVCAPKLHPRSRTKLLALHIICISLPRLPDTLTIPSNTLVIPLQHPLDTSARTPPWCLDLVGEDSQSNGCGPLSSGCGLLSQAANFDAAPQSKRVDSAVVARILARAHDTRLRAFPVQIGSQSLSKWSRVCSVIEAMES